MPKIVISTNENDNYLYYLPLAVFMWKHFEFDSIVIIPRTDSEKQQFVINQIDACVHWLELDSFHREDTQVQTSRLYASCIEYYNDDEYLMTGDVDMIPLSSYFNRDYDKVNYYGHDLTNYEHVPMCYVGMPKGKWKEVMNIEVSAKDGKDLEWNLGNELLRNPKALSEKFTDYWGVDQDILTAKLKAYGFDKCNHIKRGVRPSGAAYGRVCRGFGWLGANDFPEFIDAHLLRPGYTNENHAGIMALLKDRFPNLDFTWFDKYREKYLTFVK